MPDAPIHVLLIEGQAQRAHPLRETLSASGDPLYHLTQEDHLSAALTLLQQRFDVILLNLTLSDAQGLDELAQVQDRTGQAPIIALLDPANRDLALGTGEGATQVHLIVGHFGPEALAQAMEDAVGCYEQVKTPSRQGAVS
jgi:DNA-binding NarL/FixJ family response regulator